MKFLFTISLFVLAASLCQAQNFALARLQCEHKTGPLAINTFTPVFSWQMQSSQRGVVQTYYRVMVSGDSTSLKQNRGNTWVSRKVKSDNSTQVFFDGSALEAGKTYYWKVQVWNNKNEFAQSRIAQFATGLITPADWGAAKWIGYEQMPDTMRTVPGVSNVDTKKKLGPDKLKQRVVVPLFRKEFNADKKIHAAKVYITGLGQYELSINGAKVGNSFLAPGWTHYDNTVLYNAYDVTAAVKQGKNAIGVIVGNGFYYINRERYIKLAIAYGYPMMICKMVITYTDGSSKTLVSDESWQTSSSPITFTSLYGGEDYDARLEQVGWDKVNFQAKNWKSVVLVAAPKGRLEAEMDAPVQVKKSLGVKNVSKPKDSIYIFDFAQNLSGIVELKVKGKKGQVIKLSPGELLHSNGLINQNATGRPYYYSYTLKGDGVETWRPRFTYTGFRYVQVEGAIPDTANSRGDFATIVGLRSLHTSNASDANGSFTCSNRLFNRIHTLIDWAIRSNLQSVVTDCPHREKLSWLEQDYLMGNGINASYNVYQLYKKLVNDMMDAQTPEGLVPDIAPEFVFFDDNGFGFRDSPEWGSAAVIVPWLLYKWYGDSAILQQAYPMMQRYVSYLEKKSSNHILNYGLGDWFDYGPAGPGVAQLTPVALTATAIYYHDTKLLSLIAARLNQAEASKQYDAQALEIRKAFTDTFYNKTDKVFATGSQTAMSMPLVLGLVPDQDRAAVLQNLVDSIKRSGYKLTAGDVGFHFLIEALHNGGESQTIYDMNFRDDVPGYGYQLKKGATALTESWPALESVSNNHLMLGHIMQWFYEGIGGINQADSSVGYKHIVIKPELVGDLSFAAANHQTWYGNISTTWRKEARQFKLSISIPANTSATIYLPTLQPQKVKEGSTPLLRSKDVKLMGQEQDRTMVKVGSGQYDFVIED